MWRTLGLLVLFWAGVVLIPQANAADGPTDQRPPNIVFILIDDLGWTDLGCYGSDYYQTPAIDRLAAEGVKFTQAYTCGPNCAPTRASLMSGQYPPSHGIYTVGAGARGKPKFRKLDPPENRTVLPPSYVTLAEVLSEAGYATGHFGKWHLGSAPQAGPRQQGFDVNVGGNHRGSPPTYFSPYRNSTIEDGPPGEYLTDRLTDEVVRFIDKHRAQPFFVYLPHYAVHTPIQAPNDLTETYRQRPAGKQHDNPEYAAMIDRVDRSVAAIVAKLMELQLLDKTMIVLTSDNGGVGGYAAAGVPGGREITAQAPLRGGKGMLYEGGVRVPLIVRWPGQVKAGSTCDVPNVTTDWYPTLAAVAGAEKHLPDPKTQPLAGVSLVPLLKGVGRETAGPSRELTDRSLFWHFPGYLEASVAEGTWRTTPAGAIRQGDWKLLEFFETGEVELYNLRDDIGETRNLAADQPERAAKLRAQLQQWRRALNARMPQPR